MGEDCIYNDNSGKGKKDDKKKNEDQFPAVATTSNTVGRGKRRRKSSGPYSGDEESDGTYTPQSRESSLIQNPTAYASANVSPPPGLGNGVINIEGELETRMNRLVEIVDQWYKDAYGQGVTAPNLQSLAQQQQIQHQQVDEGNIVMAIQSAMKDVNGLPPALSPQQWQHLQNQFQQQQQLNNQRPYLGAKPPLSPTAQNPPPRPYAAPTEPVAAPVKETPTPNCAPPLPPILGNSQSASLLVDKLANYEKIVGKDGEVEDLALGHLSIQDGGRSRYVGSSFWAFLTTEITELNQVLKTQHKSCNGPLASVTAEKMNSTTHLVNGGLTTPASSVTTGSPISAGMCWKSLATGVDKAMLLDFEPHGASSSVKDLPSMLYCLPPKTQCDSFYKSFLNGVHPVMPLIHTPTFAKEYQAFWSWYPDNIHTVPSSELIDNPTFLPLLFSILYAGAMSMSSKLVKTVFEGQTKESISNHFYAATTNSLALTSFPRSPTINSLTAFLIVQTCQIREEEPLTSCSFVSMAMRVAQSMGLHRDGSLFGLGEVDCEIRRRVWWHIMYLDVQSAIATGLPPLGGSGEDLFDTRMVSELRDEYIGGETPDYSRPSSKGSASISGSSHSSRSGISQGRKFSNVSAEQILSRTSPAMILAIGRYESTLLLRKIVCRLFGIKPPKKSDLCEMGEMIFALKAKLEEKIARIPARGMPEMGFIPPHGDKVEENFGNRIEQEGYQEAERTGIFNSWARIMLSMLTDRAFGVLYQPFLKSTKSKLWLHARNCALRSCHSFLRKFIHLSRSPLFQPYQWFCPGTYQPLHATMILLLDLYERPFTAEAPRSRVYVDEVFALFGEHGNYSTGDGEVCPRPLMEGGREAWKMLGRLRRKAYFRAGLGVEVLPLSAEEEQAHIQRENQQLQQTVGERGDGQDDAEMADYRHSLMQDDDMANEGCSHENEEVSNGNQEWSGALESGVSEHSKTGNTQQVAASSYSHSAFTGGPSSSIDATMGSLGDHELTPIYHDGELGRMFINDHSQPGHNLMNLQQVHAQSASYPSTPILFQGNYRGETDVTGGVMSPSMGEGAGVGLAMESMGVSREDFNWEEWDAVFGKYVAVDVDEAVSPWDWEMN
ncbi:hypothetical protein RUND412_007186 [Rhizina undulata]